MQPFQRRAHRRRPQLLQILDRSGGTDSGHANLELICPGADLGQQDRCASGQQFDQLQRIAPTKQQTRRAKRGLLDNMVKNESGKVLARHNSPMPNHTEEKGRMKMPAFLTAHKADWVCLHVGRRPVILYLRRDGSVPVAGVVVDHVLFVERLLPVQDV